MPWARLLDRNHVHRPGCAGHHNERACSFFGTNTDSSLCGDVFFSSVNGWVGGRVRFEVAFALLVAIHRNAPLLSSACHQFKPVAHYRSNGADLITSAAFRDIDSWP